jgi:hypothetical protein
MSRLAIATICGVRPAETPVITGVVTHTIQPSSRALSFASLQA